MDQGPDRWATLKAIMNMVGSLVVAGSLFFVVVLAVKWAANQ